MTFLLPACWPFVLGNGDPIGLAAFALSAVLFLALVLLIDADWDRWP